MTGWLSRRARVKFHGTWLFAVLPVAAFFLLFYLAPLEAIISRSFAGAAGQPIRSSDWGVLAGAVGFSFGQALLSTGLTALLGLPAAFVLYRTQFRGRDLLRTLTTIPFILPTVVVAAAINSMAGSRGWLNLILQSALGLAGPPIKISGTLAAIVIAHIFYNITIVIRMVGTAWSRLNPRLEQAAKTLGANPAQITSRVTLPVLLPAILSALLLVFLFDFTSYGVVLLLGGPGLETLEVEIYNQTMVFYNLQLAGILSGAQLLVCLTVIVLQAYFSAKHIPLVPAAESSQYKFPQDFRGRLATLAVLIMLVFLILAPMFSLAASSFFRFEPGSGSGAAQLPAFTLDYYRALGSNLTGDLFYIPPVRAILNSVAFALITAAASITIGVLFIFGLPRKAAGRKLFDTMLMLPLGTSAVTIGLGYILFFNRPPFKWGSAWWLIPMAHTLVALPFVIRGISQAVNSLPDSYRQSAVVLGASGWQRLWLVDLPLVKSSLASSAIFAFTISLGEFGATSMLYRPEYPTLPVAIFRFLSQPGGLNYGQAMAMSTVLMAACAIGVFIIEKSLFFTPKADG